MYTMQLLISCRFFPVIQLYIPKISPFDFLPAGWQGTEFFGHGYNDATTRSASERSLGAQHSSEEGGNFHSL